MSAVPPSMPPQGPPADVWRPPEPWPPPAWAMPGLPPRPRREVNWLVLVGGVLVFFGYVFFAVGDLVFIGLPPNPTSAQVLGVATLFIVGRWWWASGSSSPSSDWR